MTLPGPFAAMGDGDWRAGVEAGKRLAEALHGSGVPDEAEIERVVRELVERLSKISKKLGSSAAGVLSFVPLAHAVRSIGRGFSEAQEWLGSAARGDAASPEDAFAVHVKCRVLLARRFDLLEAIIESFLKRKHATAPAIIASIVSKTKASDKKLAGYQQWWAERFQDRLLVPYEEFWAEYYKLYKELIEQKGDEGVSAWRAALQQCVDYTQDGVITVHEFGFLCVWWFPGSFSPRSIGLLLKQGYFQPYGDRRNYNKFLRSPGDYFVRNTINQGGGWCISHIDPYLKVKHTLLVHTKDGWEFPGASSKERAVAVSVVGVIQKNTDCLQMPRGDRYESLPTIDWDGYTHAQGAEEESALDPPEGAARLAGSDAPPPGGS